MGTNITWKVTDSGGTIQCSGTGTATLAQFNNPSCSQISILDGGQGAAKITAIDGGADILKLENTKIRANANIVNWHLIIEKDFNPGPQGGNWWYKTAIVGTLNNTDPSNAISVTTQMFNPLGTLNTNSTLSVSASESQPFNKFAGPQVNPALNNQARKIIVNLTMTLKNTHTVDFSLAGNLIQVIAQNTQPFIPPNKKGEGYKA